MSTDKKVTRLEELEVHEVSVVDKGANKRTLLVVKNAGEDMADENLDADDLNTRDDGSPLDDGDEDFGADPASVSDDAEVESVEQAAGTDAVVEAQAVAAAEDTSLVVGMDPDTQASFVEMLKGMQDRIGALGLAVGAAKAEPGAATSPKLAEEIGEIAKTLGRLVGVNKGEALKALHGEKESLMFEMDPSKMALTKEGATYSMPLEMAAPMVCEYAREMLYQAADMMYKPYDMDSAYGLAHKAQKALGPFLSEETKKQYAYNQPQASISAGVPDSKAVPNPATKAAAITPERLDQLEKAIEGLQGDTKPAPKPATVAKSEDSELHGKVKELVKLCKSQQEEIATLKKGSRGVGNSASVGDEAPEGDGQSDVVWPDDLTTLIDQD